jgi:hypothetical protein
MMSPSPEQTAEMDVNGNPVDVNAMTGFGPGVQAPQPMQGGGFNVFQAGGVRDRIKSLVGQAPMRKAVAGSPMPSGPVRPGGGSGGVRVDRGPMAR